MIKLKFFNSIVAAELASNLLKESGIKNMLQKRGLEFSGDLGDSYGADLFVEEKDVKSAKECLGDE